jgi:hypothetical protein
MSPHVKVRATGGAHICWSLSVATADMRAPELPQHIATLLLWQLLCSLVAWLLCCNALVTAVSNGLRL